MKFREVDWHTQSWIYNKEQGSNQVCWLSDPITLTNILDCFPFWSFMSSGPALHFPFFYESFVTGQFLNFSTPGVFFYSPIQLPCHGSSLQIISCQPPKFFADCSTSTNQQILIPEISIMLSLLSNHSGFPSIHWVHPTLPLPESFFSLLFLSN